MSWIRSATLFPASATSKQPQSMAVPRKRLTEMATMKTRRRAPTRRAAVRRQIRR